MKFSLIRTICSILIGIMIFWGISLCLPHKVPGGLSTYLPLAIGSLISGYIAGNRGWLVGLIIGMLNFLIIQLILSILTLPSIGKLSLPPFDASLLSLFIIIGTVLGALGQWTKKHIFLPKQKLGESGDHTD